MAALSNTTVTNPVQTAEPSVATSASVPATAPVKQPEKAEPAKVGPVKVTVHPDTVETQQRGADIPVKLVAKVDVPPDES